MKLSATPITVGPVFRPQAATSAALQPEANVADLVEINGEARHSYHKDANGGWSKEPGKPGAAAQADVKKWLGSVFLPSNLPTRRFFISLVNSRACTPVGKVV